VPNAAVQRPRVAPTSAARAHNEMTRLRRARDAVSRGTSYEKVDTHWLAAAALERYRRLVSERRV
jgi:hypothetical protein